VVICVRRFGGPRPGPRGTPRGSRLPVNAGWRITLAGSFELIDSIHQITSTKGPRTLAPDFAVDLGNTAAMDPTPPAKRRRISNRIQGVLQRMAHPPSPPSRSTPDLTPGNNPSSPRPLPSPDLSAIAPAPAQIRGPTREPKVSSTSNVGAVLSTASLATPAAPVTANGPSEAWSMARSGLEVTLRLLEKSADAFPPLKSAVGGLVACLDVIQESYGCRFTTDDCV
jgi:hypothetical protein